MSNAALIYLIDSVLGNSKPTSKGNRAYHCPECKHHKLKLEVNLDETSQHFQSYNCWTSLLNPPSNLTAKQAIHYLNKRGISKIDILKYNIGYCEFGVYSNMIILPSYDSNGNLNYFTSRSFNKNSKIKYKNPDVSRDIIGLELFINWNTPIVLCEGVFDAIAIKRNAIPLLGKTIQNNLMKKIINSTVQNIYIALDKDAMKQALNFCENLMNEGKEVYLVDIDDKDPSDMGFVKFTNLIQNTLPLTFSNLLEKKLQRI